MLPNMEGAYFILPKTKPKNMLVIPINLSPLVMPEILD
ncbi:hypothetical protein B4168_4001 [Anoxybacillus flavithermus]|nr:hypothetical protein B4168_4001 [Anoxybacillus flavithermus]OAO87621.1 hypothetical protein GT23_1270 [Parageobacillus thermoglucosidasius]